MSWCPDCCPCFSSKPPKLKRSDKYSYVRYTASKPKPVLKKSASVDIPDVKVAPPEQVFEFPQDKADISSHPQMFVESPVTQQPMSQPNAAATSSGGRLTMRRFSSLPAGTTSVTGLPHAPRRASTLPRSREASPLQVLEESTEEPAAQASESEHSHMLPRTSSISLPDLTMTPMLTHGATKKHQASLLTRRRSDPNGGRAVSIQQQEVGWVPGLPVLEETTLSENAHHPLLQFSLHYDVQRCTLTVHLHHGSNLPAMDRRGTSDPFVVLYLMPNKEEIFESRVIQQTLDPVFDQSFEFKKLTPDDICQQTLILHVYDHDKFSRNDSIGGVILPLENADLFGVVMRMKIDPDPTLFNQNTKGDLLLALSYDMALSSIKGVVLKATNLKKQDVIGLADPYIKIRLHHNDKVIDKWKSSIKRHTLIPVFNESFQFDVLGKDVGELVMEVLVMDYDRFSRDDVVGVIRLSRQAEGECERRHWTDMITGSPQVISQWHTIQPA